MDLAGSGGASASLDADLSPEAQAARLAGLVEERNTPVVLFGHSLGGGIVALASLLLKDRGRHDLVRGLVLVSAAILPLRLPPYLRLARLRGVGELLLLTPPPLPLLRLGLRGIVRRKDSIDAALVAGYRAPLLDRDHRRAILRAARQIDPATAHLVSGRLGELELPVLLVWGGADPVVPPEHGRRLAAGFPHATLHILPGLGHLPPEEDPEGSLIPVIRFLSELRAPPAGARPPG